MRWKAIGVRREGERFKQISDSSVAIAFKTSLYMLCVYSRLGMQVEVNLGEIVRVLAAVRWWMMVVLTRRGSSEDGKKWSQGLF